MKLMELLKKTPLFNHLQYPHKPLTDANLDTQLIIEYGNRTLKPSIELMMNDPLYDSYLTIMFNTIETLYSNKWDRIIELESLEIANINRDVTTTTTTTNDSSSSINSVWGITDTEDQNKDKTSNVGNTSTTSMIDKKGKLELDNINHINNISLVCEMISDVANYFCLYIIE